MRPLTGPHYGVLGCVVIAKVLLAMWMPLTGDEAYFIVWGQHPALGYYDHPPLAGWWLAAVLPLSDHILAIRFAALVVSLLPAFLIYHSLRDCPLNQWSAMLIALFLPVFAINIFYTTDTWLIGFGILAMWSYVAATRDDRVVLYLVSGLCLGLAFFSKYLAVLIGLGMLVDQLIRGRHAIRNLCLILFPVLPFAAVNLWWNARHCGYNLMFNFVNRQSDADWNLSGLLTYFAMLLYVMTPWLIIGVIRHRHSATGVAAGEPRWQWLWVTPLVVLALVSLMKPVGLHWVIPVLFAFLMAANLQSWSTLWLRRAALATAVFGTLHYLILITVALVPVEQWIQPDRADRVGFYRYGNAVGADLNARLDASWVLASPSYSRGAVLSYHTKRSVPVIGAGSRYGRQSDLLHDWAVYDGEKIAVVGATEAELEGFKVFFKESRLYPVSLHGKTTYWMLQGEGFQATQYMAMINPMIAESFYQIPTWMPVSHCELIERSKRVETQTRN